MTRATRVPSGRGRGHDGDRGRLGRYCRFLLRRCRSRRGLTCERRLGGVEFALEVGIVGAERERLLVVGHRKRVLAARMVDPTAPGISLGHGWIELDRLGVFLNAAAEVALNVFEAAQVGIGDRPVVGAFRVTPLEEGLAANIGVVAVPVDAGVPVLVARAKTGASASETPSAAAAVKVKARMIRSSPGCQQATPPYPSN